MILEKNPHKKKKNKILMDLKQKKNGECKSNSAKRTRSPTKKVTFSWWVWCLNLEKPKNDEHRTRQLTYRVCFWKKILNLKFLSLSDFCCDQNDGSFIRFREFFFKTQSKRLDWCSANMRRHKVMLFAEVCVYSSHTLQAYVSFI